MTLANLDGRNLGLQDARKAYEFIHENVHKFGGDNSLITLIGDGYGAVTAAALSSIYSKSEKFSGIQGLFLQSGTFSSPWAYTDKSMVEQIVRVLFTNFHIANNTFYHSNSKSKPSAKLLAMSTIGRSNAPPKPAVTSSAEFSTVPTNASPTPAVTSSSTHSGKFERNGYEHFLRKIF